MATYTITASDSITAHGLLTYSGLGVVLHDAISVHDSPSFRALLGAFAGDAVRVSHVLTRYAIMKGLIAEGVGIHDDLARALSGPLHDSITATDALALAWGMVVADELGVHSSLSASGRFKISIPETLLTNDALAWFYGGALADRVLVSGTFHPQWQFARSASDRVVVDGVFKPTLQISISAVDNVDFTDESILQAIFRATLSDNVSVAVAFIEPSGSFTAWAVNTRTSAITEYQNFAFNSFAKMGNHYLGASADGLFQLDGALDDAASIIAQVKSGSAQFTGSRFTSFSEVYLGCRVQDGASDWVLKLHTGDGRCYVYQFQPLDQRTTKIFTGKGLRARYFSWELVTAGEDFDLDAIEFVPIIAKRRV